MAAPRPLARGWRAVVAALAVLVAGIAFAAGWRALADDGIHDPSSPAVHLLQQPGEALAALPRDAAGNQVDWMAALDRGLIRPRSSVSPNFEVRLRNTDVLRRETANQPMVVFPHRQHTAWIDCVTCHSGLFEMRAGATRMNMLQILSGEKCGQCHGAVAFPLTECARCHRVRRGSPEAAAFGNGIVRDAGAR
jgi:c(7)-type cytochrome triheme protein